MHFLYYNLAQYCIIFKKELFNFLGLKINDSTELHEKRMIELIKDDPYSIQFIVNPSEQLQLYAIKLDPYSIRHINKPSELVQLAAINKNVYLIEYINNPSESIQLESIKCFNVDLELHFMKSCYPKIRAGLALNLLYKKVKNIKFKELIKNHPNYKNDAQLVLEKLNP